MPSAKCRPSCLGVSVLIMAQSSRSVYPASEIRHVPEAEGASCFSNIDVDSALIMVAKQLRIWISQGYT